MIESEILSTDQLLFVIVSACGGAVSIGGNKTVLPSLRLTLWALFRSVMVGLLAGNAALGIDLNLHLAYACTLLGGLLFEEILTAISKIGGRFSRWPIRTMRQVRGLPVDELPGEHER